jgi:hypothetical protein
VHPTRLARRLIAEALGTAFLLAAIVGSGIMAERLSGGNVGIALLCNSLATGAMLVVLIAIFGPVLMGPSGCGKTTLLRIIAHLDDRFVGDAGVPETARLGFMFQEPRLLPWRTVQQNIELVAPTGFSEADLQQLAAAVGIADMLPRYPQELSLGLARRLRSPEPSPRDPTCCSSTSLSYRLTSAPPTVCAASYSKCGGNGLPPRSLSPTIRAGPFCLPTGSCCWRRDRPKSSRAFPLPFRKPSGTRPRWRKSTRIS